MSANATAPVATLTGKISSVDWYPRKNPTRFTTLLRLPAADEFETPATVEVTSSHSIGDEGEVVKDLKVQIGGRYRSYPVTDKQTGEVRSVRTADNILTVL